MRKDLWAGSVFVLLGAACYGVLSTCVKLAYTQGYSPAEVLASQFISGLVALACIDVLCSKRQGATRAAVNTSDRIKLMLGGSTIGFTGTFYYLSVAFTSVATAVVLLMQSVWMGVVLEAALTRHAPAWRPIVSSALILAGTVVATGVAENDIIRAPIGIGYGLMAAVSYTGALWCSKNIGTHVHPASRSYLMIVGGTVVVVALALPQLLVKCDVSVFWRWGWLTALLGTILPPFLFNKGVPATGVGLASILSSAELPIAIIMACLVLNEPFSLWQWAGVVTIMMAIVASSLDIQTNDRGR